MKMRIVEAKPRGVNIIGKFHEGNTTLVKFDLSEYMADYGDLNIVLVHKRNGDDVAIPSTGFSVVDGVGEWIVSENDTSFVGCGEAEVQFRDDSHCRKSATYTTMVLDSPSNGTYPQSDVLKSYADEIAKIGASVVSATVGYAAIQKLKQYTYEVWYDKLDYTGAFNYFKNNDEMTPAACSSIRNGSVYGRNYDLYYDNESTFVVHVPAIGNRYATTAVCGGFKKLTQDYVDGKTADSIYGVLPFQVLDGFNEHGVYANVNVVPYDKDYEYAGPEEYDFEISANMLIRYILDYFDSATEAVEYVRDHVRVVMSKALRKLKYDVHFMVADAEHTYVIEFVGGETKIVEQNRMTNFHLFGVTPNDDGTVYTPATQDEEHDAVVTNGIEEYGSGLERYNLIANGYDSCNTKAGMRAMLDALKYTNAYSADEPVWYTEFVGGELYCNSPVDAFADAVDKAREEYASRTREDPKTWQTVHSTVYDMLSGKMYLVTQEENEEFEFEIAQSGIEIDDDTTSTTSVWSSRKIQTELDEKVDAVEGKGLSTNDFTDEYREKVDGAVQSEEGKGLSANDFTDAAKSKLDDIEDGATKTVIDAELSESSDNPVENKAIKAKFDDIDASLSSVNQAIMDIAQIKHRLTTGINQNPGQIESGYYANEGGSVVKASGSTNYGVSKLIEVYAGDIVRCVTGNNVNYKGLVTYTGDMPVLVTSSDNIVRHYFVLDETPMFYYEYVVPANITGVRYQYETSLVNVADMLTINAVMPASYVEFVDDPYTEVTLKSTVNIEHASQIKDFVQAVKEALDNPLAGKKVGFLGDSFTDVSYYYGGKIADRTGIIDYNYGVQGSRIYSDNTYLSEGENVTRQAFWRRVVGMNDALDCIVVFGGINDASSRAIYETELGTIEDEALTQTDINNGLVPESFYSACKTVYELIMEKYPGKKILMVIPPHVLTADYDPSIKAYTGIEKIIEAERNVSMYYGIPVCDLWQNCTELNNFAGNVAEYRIGNSNNIHPNDYGHYAMSTLIQKAIEQLFIE